MAWTGGGMLARRLAVKAEAEGDRVPGEWSRAFERWLSEKALNTQRAYRRAWDDLCVFTGKVPVEMLSGMVKIT